MFNKLPRVDAVEVVERSVIPIQCSLAHREDEIALGQYPVKPGIFDHEARAVSRLESRTKRRYTAFGKRVVPDEVRPVDVLPQFCGLTLDKNCLDEFAHDINAGGGLRKALEQRLQALAAIMGLRVVLDVFRLVNDGDRRRVARLDAFEEGLDLVLSSFLAHRALRLFDRLSQTGCSFPIAPPGCQ